MQRSFYIFCLAVAVFGMLNTTFAQKGKSDISFQYGYYSTYSVYDAASNSTPVSASSGTGSLNYKYYISDIVSVGCGFGYENNSNYGSSIAIAPEFTFRYLDTRDNRVRVRLYATAAWGLRILNYYPKSATDPDQSGPKLDAFQISPIGIRVGRKYAAFFELGYGYKGIVNCGVAYRFRTTTIHEQLERR